MVDYYRKSHGTVYSLFSFPGCCDAKSTLAVKDIAKVKLERG
jgi:hypothetical protein